MPESTLSLAYADIQLEVGYFAGYGADYTTWTAAQVATIDRIIQEGLRKFYYPLNPITKETHKWSFLEFPLTISTIASYSTGTVSSSGAVVTLTGGVFPTWAATNGTITVNNIIYNITSRDGNTQITLTETPSVAFNGDTFVLEHDGNYTLDDNFGSMSSQILTFESDYSYAPVRIISEVEIRKMRQVNNSRLAPRFAAIRAKTSTGATGQRFEIIFYPIPDAAYVLSGMYDVYVNKIDRVTYPYPLGGMKHSDTIKASCLAVADKVLNDAIGVNAEDFERLLAISISQDQLTEPDYYGHNNDNSDCMFMRRRNIRIELNINGVRI
jgi:hypothetical protein